MKNFLLLLFVNVLFAQGLFESAQQNASRTYELTGNISSTFLVDVDADSLFSKGLFSNANLQITAKKKDIGFAFADIRFRNSFQNDQQNTDIILREAYVDVSLGHFNTRLGKQILPWGRSDVYRSTDNITPQDMRSFFIDHNDKRMGNFLLNSSLQIGNKINIQGIWIPRYVSNEFPISIIALPEGMEYIDLTVPETSFNNSGAALKLDLRTSRYDVSLSYLNAYALQPSLASRISVISPTLYSFKIFPQAWRQQVYGFDASLSHKTTSFRFEGSYMRPSENPDVSFTPNSEFQWTVGLDRSEKNISILFEYNFKVVANYRALLEPSDPNLILNYNLTLYNRLFFQQTNEVEHHIFARMAINMFHETLELEFPVSYNLNTKEFLLASQIHWALADALQLTLGFNIYHGDEATLFNLLKPLYNGYFCELKLNF
jgi:hypothetical protein